MRRKKRATGAPQKDRVIPDNLYRAYVAWSKCTVDTPKEDRAWRKYRRALKEFLGEEFEDRVEQGKVLVLLVRKAIKTEKDFW